LNVARSKRDLSLRETLLGLVLVAATIFALVAAAVHNLAAGKELGWAKYFHVLANDEIPIVPGVGPAFIFLPATIVAIALIVAFHQLGEGLFFDAVPQLVFLALAGAQVWVIYRFLVRLVRRFIPR
jgi:hypothetical protein